MHVCVFKIKEIKHNKFPERTPKQGFTLCEEFLDFTCRTHEVHHSVNVCMHVRCLAPLQDAPI